MLPHEKKLTTKEQLKNWLKYEQSKYDVRHWRLKAALGSETALLFKTNYLLRKTEFYYNNGKKIRYFLYYYKLKKHQNKFGLHIPLNCCGKGLKIMHLGSILINQNSIVGEDCSIHIGVRIVAGGHDSAAPTIGGVRFRRKFRYRWWNYYCG